MAIPATIYIHTGGRKVWAKTRDLPSGNSVFVSIDNEFDGFVIITDTAEQASAIAEGFNRAFQSVEHHEEEAA